MATRQIEIPENHINKAKLSHNRDWLTLKVYTLLTIIGRIPFFGQKLAQTNKENLLEWLDSFYTSAHQYAFERLKVIVRNTMTEEEKDFSVENFVNLITDLEKEFAAGGLEELGTEDSADILMFAKNQSKFYLEHWDWSYSK